MNGDHSIAAVLATARQQIDPVDAEALLGHVLNKDRAYFRTWPERELSSHEFEQFHTLLARRQQGEPLAYILGWREFWSLRLKVTPATLIPRPDTEQLVEQALTLIPANAPWRIADLGTGSGAIALAIASERPDCSVVATDISSDALRVAQGNAQQLGISNVEFRHGSWNKALQTNEHFQLIAANPPYVNADDKHLQRDGLPFEPQTALTPGEDGMADIRIIIKQMKGHLISPGWLLLEHGYQQGEQVRALLTRQGYHQIITYRDLGGSERLTQGYFAP